MTALLFLLAASVGQNAAKSPRPAEIDPDWKEVIRAGSRVEAGFTRDTVMTFASKVADLDAALKTYVRSAPRRGSESRVKLVSRALVQLALSEIGAKEAIELSRIYDTEWADQLAEFQEDEIKPECDTQSPRAFVTFGMLRLAHIKEALRFLHEAFGDPVTKKSQLDVMAIRSVCRTRFERFCNDDPGAFACRHLLTKRDADYVQADLLFENEKYLTIEAKNTGPFDLELVDIAARFLDASESVIAERKQSFSRIKPGESKRMIFDTGGLPKHQSVRIEVLDATATQSPLKRQ